MNLGHGEDAIHGQVKLACISSLWYRSSTMKVGQLILAAFGLARSRNPDLHAAWITTSFRLGGLLAASTLSVSIQRAGDLDLLLRCMEDDLSFSQDDKSPSQDSDFSFTYQSMMSNLWITEMYEVFRLLKDRKLEPSSTEFESLAHHLRLLRVSIDKHEIAGERKLEGPLVMKRLPPKGDDSDIYHYSKDDLRRGHIMPSGVSRRGSVMWQVLDIASGESFWIERRTLSERIITLYGTSKT